MSLTTNFLSAVADLVLRRRVIEGQEIRPAGSDYPVLSTRAIGTSDGWRVMADFQWAAHAAPRYNAEHKVLGFFTNEADARAYLKDTDIVNNADVRREVLSRLRARETVIDAFDRKPAGTAAKNNAAVLAR